MNTYARQVCGQRDIGAAGASLEPAPPFPESAPLHPLRLAVETALVTTVTIAAVNLLSTWSVGNLWYVVPGILVAAALIPTWIGKREFPPIGLDAARIGPALVLLSRVTVWVFPAVFLGLWLLRSLEVPPPLRPVITGPRNWFTWLLYQFLYVAVAEEVFFRGYVQANTMRLLARVRRVPPTAQQCVAVLVSAACFAAAHVVVHGQIMSSLTFLPGLLLAWLFLRTRSLLAPIVFHGLANISYGIMAMALA
jgi:membrane protease YdiL (CAAX protease family)